MDDNFLTTQFYNAQGVVPNIVSIPLNKDFLINMTNNDEVEFSLPNGEKLTLLLDGDLAERQSCDILLTANEFASQNKRLDILNELENFEKYRIRPDVVGFLNKQKKLI